MSRAITIASVGAVALVFLLAATTAQAVTVIDPFDAGAQNYTSSSTGIPVDGEVSASSALGGNRYSKVVKTGGTGSNANIYVNTTVGNVSFNNSSEVEGDYTLEYGHTTALNADLSDWTGFLFDVIAVESSAGTLKVTMEAGGNTYVTGNISLPSATGDWNVSFSNFTTSPTADLGDVDKLTFFFDMGSGKDITIDMISRVVPEPSSLFLMFFGGAACIVAVRRRRRKK